MNKFIWEKDDITFIEKTDNGQQIKYSDFNMSGCPFKECAINIACNGCCSSTQESKAYDLACEIYDKVVAEADCENAVLAINLVKENLGKYMESYKDNLSFVLCVKIQLIYEIQSQYSVCLSEEIKKQFLEN